MRFSSRQARLNRQHVATETSEPPVRGSMRETDAGFVIVDVKAETSSHAIFTVLRAAQCKESTCGRPPRACVRIWDVAAEEVLQLLLSLI